MKMHVCYRGLDVTQHSSSSLLVQGLSVSRSDLDYSVTDLTWIQSRRFRSIKDL